MNKQPMITARHHGTKRRITKLLTGREFECRQLAVGNIDLAFKQKYKEAYIFDPTIGYETNNINQGDEICKEKREIYEKCIPFLNEKYAPKFGVRKWSVHDLWFGSRQGCIWGGYADNGWITRAKTQKQTPGKL